LTFRGSGTRCVMFMPISLSTSMFE
jgi:hypothetical protein